MAARLSALHNSRTLPPGFFIFKGSWYSFLLEAESTLGPVWPEGLGRFKKIHLIGTWTREKFWCIFKYPNFLFQILCQAQSIWSSIVMLILCETHRNIWYFINFLHRRNCGLTVARILAQWVSFGFSCCASTVQSLILERMLFQYGRGNGCCALRNYGHPNVWPSRIHLTWATT
jgi:hypothetical protein